MSERTKDEEQKKRQQYIPIHNQTFTLITHQTTQAVRNQNGRHAVQLNLLLDQPLHQPTQIITLLKQVRAESPVVGHRNDAVGVVSPVAEKKRGG